MGFKRTYPKAFGSQMNALDQPVHLVDSFSMLICKITRADGSLCFKGETLIDHFFGINNKGLS